MVPINIEDVLWGVAAAQRLYSIGFREVNNAGESHQQVEQQQKLKDDQHRQVKNTEILGKISDFLQLTWT
jgi:hypothetical protein